MTLFLKTLSNGFPSSRGAIKLSATIGTADLFVCGCLPSGVEVRSGWTSIGDRKVNRLKEETVADNMVPVDSKGAVVSEKSDGI